MNKKALCIGNAQYPESPLRNPTNDATNLAEKLEALGFVCNVLTDATHRNMDEALYELASALSDAEVGLFFFAGHGLQIRGENYLTAVDTNFDSETDVKFSSLPLNKVIEVLENGENSTSIIILDACRSNPYERRWRGGDLAGLAPVYAPKGTIIAFATSPGQVALDGSEQNGAFTSSLLTHISHQDLTIEDLFKRVRNTLSAVTSGGQISWEHTSLMGDFYFNPSVLTDEFVAEYSPQAKADSKFHTNGSSLREIINDFKSHDWGYQNPAVSNLASIEWGQCNKDDLFVLGRNLYQSACGQAWGAQGYFENLSSNLTQLEKEVAFHILNDILYEIYFDSSDRFRETKKAGQIARVFTLEDDPYFRASFQFIQQSLKPYFKSLFYIPGSGRPVVVNVVVTPQDDDGFKVKRIIFDSEDVFYAHDGVTLITNWDPGYGEYFWQKNSVGQFESKLASEMAAPLNRLVISYSDTRARTALLAVPDYYKIRRLSA